MFFLTIGFLGYAFKYLNNIVCLFVTPEEKSFRRIRKRNAYVSGMETDLKLYGNELNYFTTFFKYGALFRMALFQLTSIASVT